MQHHPGCRTVGLLCGPPENEPHAQRIALFGQRSVQGRKEHSLAEVCRVLPQRPQQAQQRPPEHQLLGQRQHQQAAQRTGHALPPRRGPAHTRPPPARPRPVPRCLPPAGGGFVLTSSPSPLRLGPRCSAASGAQRTAPQCLMPIVSCFGPFVQENGAELRKYEEILIQTIDISRRLWYIPIRLFD